MPTLAEDYAKSGKPCVLLDHDRRFSGLNSFRFFDLFNPHFIEEPFDAVFADPPFSNISMPDLARAVEVLNGFQQVPYLFLCHIRSRGAEIKKNFSGFDIVRYSGHLGYNSIRIETQRDIFLFGPSAFLKYDLLTNKGD
jgi:16S rRNA G966 N2-methylase RsmD